MTLGVNNYLSHHHFAKYMRISLRVFNLVFVMTSSLFLGWLDYRLLFLIAPVVLIVVFDGGRAHAIDIAHGNISHLRTKSKEAEAAMIFLARQQLRIAQSKLFRLKSDYPDDPAVSTALEAIHEYYERRKWWDF